MPFQQVFDVIVVGGGILGTAVARDCAMRRLSVLLVERDDIGAGATAVVSPLVDGGNRVWSPRTSSPLIQEFDILERLAPHLFSETRVLVPANPKFTSLSVRRLAGAAAGYQKLGSTRRDRRVLSLTPEEWSARVPFAPLAGGGIEHTQLLWDPSRFAVLNAKAAEQASAQILLNAHVEEVGYENGRVVGVRLRRHGGRAEFAFGKTVVVAAGAGMSRVRGVPFEPHELRKETALFLNERVPATIALASSPAPTFLMPWRSGTWVGNWSSEFWGNPFHTGLESGEAALLAHHFLERPGLQGLWRPSHFLTRVQFVGESTKRFYAKSGFAAADYQEPALHDFAASGMKGLFTLGGGNAGFCRLVAEKTTHAVCELLKHREECRTAFESLPGGSHDIPWQEEAQRTGLPPRVVHGIMKRHGYHAVAIFEQALERAELARTLCECEGIIAAEVEYCAKEEWATSLRAVGNRTGLHPGLCQGVRCATGTAQFLARLLSKDARPFLDEAREWVAERLRNQDLFAQGSVLTVAERDHYLSAYFDGEGGRA